MRLQRTLASHKVVDDAAAKPHPHPEFSKPHLYTVQPPCSFEFLKDPYFYHFQTAEQEFGSNMIFETLPSHRFCRFWRARAASVASSRLAAAEDRHSAFVFVLSAALGRFVEHSQRVPANDSRLFRTGNQFECDSSGGFYNPLLF